MSARGGKLVATYKSTIISEPLLDAIVMEDGQGNGCFPDPPWTDESDRGEIFYEVDGELDQVITSETGSGPRGWDLSGRVRFGLKMLDSSVG